jgi:DNA polymerase-3 subunit alpha
MHSLIDAISKPEQIIEKLKQNNQNCIALTDHGNTYGAVYFYKLCQKNNIKFIYGCEFYICDDINIKDKNNRYYHLIILAKSEEGRINLNKLLTHAYVDGFYYKCRIDFNLLKQYKDGLIILSACQAGEIQRNLEKEDYQKAEDIAMQYKNEFGEDYYIEIQSSHTEAQLILNRKCVDLAKKININYVATCDSHYIDKKDQKIHSIFIQIGRNQEVGETYTDTYLQSEDEVKEILSLCLNKQEVDLAINNTIDIANKCNVKIPLSAPQIPHNIVIPKEFNDENDYLKYLCNIGWKNKKLNKLPKLEQQIYIDRFKYEFDAISRMGFSGYYLLVEDYVNSATRRGIARGSGGGSLIAYLMNIVDIDPIEYGLYFERFIDVSALDLLESGTIKPEELKIPDFDSDFGGKSRENVIEFISNKYGKEKVACIGSFMYMKDRTAVKDIGRVLNIPFEITNEITKVLGDESLKTALEDGLLDNYKDKYKELFDNALQLIGLPKSFSKHPCGRCITINELNYYFPLCINDNEMVIMADMHDVEDCGIVKVDLLGLRTIDVIYDTLELIGKDYEYINPKNINFKDEKVLKEVFRNGNTIGCFQFESEGMCSTLNKMDTSCLDDLINANALYRPGSLAYIDNYTNRKLGKEKFEYLHPDLKPILKNSYGIIVFQEQLIEIGKLAGLRNPDQIRKATAKKIPELMAIIEPELKNGLIKRGWEQNQVDILWEDILKFSKYSFNKSHSAAYAIIAYITGFLKTYHPTEFMCSLINSFEDKHDELTKCFKESLRLGVKINFDFLNNPIPLCEVENGQINYGLSLIKYCNREIAYELQKIKGNNYDNFIDLLIDISQLSINSKQLSILIKLDSFPKIAKTQKLLTTYEYFQKLYNKKSIKKDKLSELKIDENIIKKYSKETDKTYKDLDSIALLKELYEQIPNESISIALELQTQLDYLNACITTIPNLKYDIAVVTDTNLKATPRLKMYHLSTGEEITYKIYKKTFNKNPLNNGDFIYISNKEFKQKPIPIKDADGQVIEWQKSEEREWLINSYRNVDIQKFQNWLNTQN